MEFLDGVALRLGEVSGSRAWCSAQCGHTTHSPREVIALILVSAPILLPAGSSQPRNGQERSFQCYI